MGRSTALTDRPLENDYTQQVRRREEAAWQRYGPVAYRLVKLLRLVILLAATGMAIIVVNTLAALYQGTGSVGATGPDERLVQVRVDSCDRRGPLHDWRLGFWWTCQVSVLGGGQAAVDRSIVTDEDVGRTIELLQACYNPPGTHCTLGKPASALGQVYAGGLRWLERLGLIVVAGWAFSYLLAALIGARGFIGFIAWWRRLR
ncbi:hypothetical protein Acy02nite_87410 [Actinoplanes cyaneus]|uniref:Uncharacterized protein n=1 Tax=Actinoplanes cyaneus TaxID=52696 RepID=A0A919IRF8_9ACTN|nr:DUF6346 domain-containing protein [Actinoplanes cyaneus]MCW2144105.1 hypothetical protein [Actinoplanes cyaneus]GID70860.1 hypothetical protein Acy02nite_87410 [Actinoplanes cyaneus]